MISESLTVDSSIAPKAVIGIYGTIDFSPELKHFECMTIVKCSIL